MTETEDPRTEERTEEIVAAAIARIDTELAALTHRNLIASDQVSDLLLDMRMLLAPLSRPVVPSAT